MFEQEHEVTCAQKHETSERFLNVTLEIPQKSQILAIKNSVPHLQQNKPVIPKGTLKYIMRSLRKLFQNITENVRTPV